MAHNDAKISCGVFCGDIFSWTIQIKKATCINNTRHIIPYLLHAECPIPHELDIQMCTFSKHFLPHFLLPFSPLIYHSDFLTPIPWPSPPFSSYLWLSGLMCRPPFSLQTTRIVQATVPLPHWALTSKGKGFCELEHFWHVYFLDGGDGHPVPLDFSSALASEQAKAAKAAPGSIPGCSPWAAWWGTVQCKIPPVLAPLNLFLVAPFTQMKTLLVHRY